jgi:hypothetical protein
MRRIRFTIASLLAVILLVAVGFAALRESSDLWESGLFTVTLCLLLISILLAIHRTESRRAFWLGFALFGSGYLAHSLVPPVESRLMTTKALQYLDSKVRGRPRAIKLYVTVNSGTGSNQAQIATYTQGEVKIWDAVTGKLLGGWGGTTENFVRIGHSLFALLAAWFGGLLSRRLWQSRERHDSADVTLDCQPR